MKTIASVLVLGLLACATSAVTHAATVIKFATVAPEGSSWMEVLREATTEIKAKTAGRVEFKLYPGGIAGDEPDVLRKMRVGQYHAAGFTGVGMGELVSETRVMELPFLFQNLKELDHVKGKLTPEIERKFDQKGYVFLGWAEPGLVYMFAQKAIRSASDMNGVKLWAWEGDPLADAMFKTFKVTPVHIALPDVLMGLQTGMLNAVYSPPLAAMALQWHTKVKFMMDEPLTNSTGGVLVSKKIWGQLSAADQATVRGIFNVALTKLTEATRKQNAEAIEKFKQLGIKVESLGKAGRDEMIKAAVQVRPMLVGKLYSQEFLKKTEEAIAEYRKKGGGK